MTKEKKMSQKPKHKVHRTLIRKDGHGKHGHKTSPWWQVLCLTGVDYFSTLGYQPGIAALAAGALAPFATLVLIILTVFGALPMYCKVGEKSPRGQGSIAMLEKLLPWWMGKSLVLGLIGVALAAFILTITLSAADSMKHILENPYAPLWLQHQDVPVTLVLITLLGVVFLFGFQEAIVIAVPVVSVYLLLNVIVLAVGGREVVFHPEVLSTWQHRLFSDYPNPLLMIVGIVVAFPKLALGLSGFETGVVVLPLVKGLPGDTDEHPLGRIANGKKLLTAAALIMSVLLFASSVITTVLIPPELFVPGGEANGRALAYLAHHYLGDVFGTVYDVSTIVILWFAGASAMAGLLNIVPQYLPRYGMVPNFARATRPLVVVFVVISYIVTIVFHADVDAQGGAYATGVLIFMGSAAVAVTIVVLAERLKKSAVLFTTVAIVFGYAIVVNIIEEPEGMRIAGRFIVGIILTSLVSRVYRSYEIRADDIHYDMTALRFMAQARRNGTISFIAYRPELGKTEVDFARKLREVEQDTRVPPDSHIIFLQVEVPDSSEFWGQLNVKGIQVGEYQVFQVQGGTAIPNDIAAILIDVRDWTMKIPTVFFGWAEGNELNYLARFIIFGEGNIAPLTQRILKSAVKDLNLRPNVTVGG